MVNAERRQASLAVAAVLAAALVTVFTVRAASPVVAAVLTAAGAIGLSWKGAASGLGRVLTQAQRPLWESELEVAVANAGHRAALGAAGYQSTHDTGRLTRWIGRHRHPRWRPRGARTGMTWPTR